MAQTFIRSSKHSAVGANKEQYIGAASPLRLLYRASAYISVEKENQRSEATGLQNIKLSSRSLSLWCTKPGFTWSQWHLSSGRGQRSRDAGVWPRFPPQPALSTVNFVHAIASRPTNFPSQLTPIIHGMFSFAGTANSEEPAV